MPHPYPYRLYRLLLLPCILFSFTASANTVSSRSGRVYTSADQPKSIHAVARVTTVALAAPTLQAKPSLVGAISLTWSAVSGATGYSLETSNSGVPGSFVLLQTFGAGDTHFRHTGLYYNQKVYYRIKAVSGTEASPFSAVASATTNAQSKVYRIMPLGDSNTEGGANVIETNEKASYRSNLEKLLNASASKNHYDFVGSEQSGSNYVNDVDHAGMGAARNKDLVTLIQNGQYTRWYDGEHMGLDYTANYLEVFSPDVILLHNGTNDISNEGVDNSQTTVNELEALLNEIDKYEASSGREVTVVLAKILQTVCIREDCFRGPSGTKNDVIDLYNQKIGELANRRIAQGDRLELVDMAEAGVIYDYAYAGGDMSDRMHPLLSGYDKMAKVWYKVLDRLLNVQLQMPDTQAPETTITSKPAQQTNSRSASFAFSSNEPGVTYQASLDGGEFVAVTNPYALSGLADGAHTLQVRAMDQAGNIDATPATYTWTVDTKAPAAPVVSVPAEDALLNQSKPEIKGTAEAGATIKVLADNTALGTARAGTDGNWSFIPGTALADGAHQVTATATDAAGNTSGASTGRNFTIDTKAPETTIVTGPPASTTENRATFSFSGSESSVTYQASIDGSAFAAAANPFELSGLADGTHTLKVRAMDAAGNTDASPATYTWTIDTTPPAPPVILAISEDRGQSASDGITSDNTLQLSGTAENKAKVSIALAGPGEVGTATADDAGNWNYSYEATELQEGNYSFTATASDALGNTSKAGSAFTATIDLTAPAAELTTQASSPTNKAFEVTIKFTEQVYGLTTGDFTLTNAGIADLKSSDEITYTATVTPASDGELTVQLPAGKAADLAGNGNTASAILKMQSDLTHPAVALTTDAPATVNKAFKVIITFSEPVEGLTLSDITVINGSVADLEQTAETTYTVLVTGAAEGEVAVSIAADMAFDAAKNGNLASNVIRRQVDNVAPTGYAVAFDVQQVNVQNVQQVPVSVTGAETGAVYSFTITSTNGGTPVTGTATVKQSSFSVPDLDLSGLNDGTLTISLYLTDEAGNKGEAATAQVQKATRDIAQVLASGEIKVVFDTDFGDIALPQKVKVLYNNGEEDYLDVTWQPGNYNQKVPGQYTVSGELTLAANTTNFGNKKGSIMIEVEPNQPPTALLLSTTRFKPDAKPTDVLGSFTTEDPEDEAFTYALVSGKGDDENKYFQIINNELHLPSNSGLSGKTAFRIRVQTRDPYNNTFEQTFVLTKSLYEPGHKIELVNAFSPDGDGINDTWTVPELRFYNKIEVTVMDRAGVRLFHTTNPEEGWDGRGKDGQVQQGPYFYIIQVEDINLVQKGVVTVIK